MNLYPGQVDDYSGLIATEIQPKKKVKSTHVTSALQAITTIETVLGTLPQGSSATVKSRIEQVEINADSALSIAQSANSKVDDLIPRVESLELKSKYDYCTYVTRTTTPGGDVVGVYKKKTSGSIEEGDSFLINGNSVGDPFSYLVITDKDNAFGVQSPLLGMSGSPLLLQGKYALVFWTGIDGFRANV
jgi:hypothetical protein